MHSVNNSIWPKDDLAKAINSDIQERCDRTLGIPNRLKHDFFLCHGPIMRFNVRLCKNDGFRVTKKARKMSEQFCRWKAKSFSDAT